MTLICYRDGILCADSGSESNSLWDEVPTLKCARNKNGDIIAASGSKAVAQKFLEWFINGEEDENPWRRDDDDDYDNVVIFRRNPRRIELYANGKHVSLSSEDRMALGYHSYLMGLMDAGLDPLQAVIIGIKRTTIGRYPIVVLGHAGEVQFWRSATEQMTLGQFLSLARLSENAAKKYGLL